MLRLINLRKSFASAGGGETVAVDGLSLEIRRGEVFGLLGPNGAGKSTTIGMAIGLVTPDSGTVEYELEGGASPMQPAVRARIGVAPQALALYEDHSGAENVEFFGTLYGLHGKRLRERVDAVLAMDGGVGLADRARDRVGGYSGGMKRRLNLAIAMVHDPDVLLLDEPTAGVDPQSRNNILDMVRLLAKQGKTVIYTTHYMEEAQRLCDRIGIIDHGKLLASGTVEELTRAHGGRSVVIVRRGSGEEERVKSDEPAREIARLAAESGSGRGAISEVRIERPDLETVFLSLTGRSLRD